MMASIRGKDTQPELLVRRLLHGLGFRYRLHDRTLPGTPDLVLRRYRTVIFVNGCFWHRHSGCRFTTKPASNADFWNQKFDMNVERDKKAVEHLLEANWKVIVIWECGLRAAQANEKLGWLATAIRTGVKNYLEWPEGT
jgi:DNA mismatch endonuclease (patch repair protein)